MENEWLLLHGKYAIETKIGFTNICHEAEIVGNFSRLASSYDRNSSGFYEEEEDDNRTQNSSAILPMSRGGGDKPFIS